MGPDALIDSRFGRCAARYPGDPVRLGSLAAGRGWFERTPAAVWWVELATVAHLHGRPLPNLDSHTRQSLRSMDSGAFRVGLIDAIDQAIAERSLVLAGHVPVAEFAEHLYDDLTRTLREEPVACAEAFDPAYLTQDHRLARIARELDRHIAAHATNGQQKPSDRTVERSTVWKDLLGVHVDGINCVEQRQSVAASWGALDVLDPSRRHQIHLFGASSPSRLESVTGADRDTPRWKLLSGQLLDRLTGTDWARTHYLDGDLSEESDPKSG